MKQITRFLLALLLCFCSIVTNAQQRFFGNVSVPSGGQITVFGPLNFTDNAPSQIINAARTAPSGIVNIAEGANILNAGANGHVDGYVRKLGSSALIFPVGNNGFYGPFSAIVVNTTGAYVHQDPSSATFSTSSKEGTVSVVSPTEYWDISGTNPTPITLTWSTTSNLAGLAGVSSRLTILGWQNGKWVSISSSIDATSILGGVSSLASGSITTTNPIIPDSYDAYTLGFLQNPLPVTLVSFVAKKEGNTAALTWETVSESNSDRFEIERSRDGKHWNKLGSVASFKESKVSRSYYFTDRNPLGGENLYRLKMVDSDETFAYSLIRLVDFGNTNRAFALYPNPAKTLIKIESNGFVFNKTEVKISDISGRDFSKSLHWVGDDLNVEGLANGIYILTIPGASGVSTKAKFVIQK